MLGGSAAAVRALCAHAAVDVNCLDFNAQTPLHLAAAAAAADVIDALLATPGLDPAAGSLAETPLHCACGAGGHPDPADAVRRLGVEWQRRVGDVPALSAWLGRPPPPAGPEAAKVVRQDPPPPFTRTSVGRGARSAARP